MLKEELSLPNLTEKDWNVKQYNLISNKIVEMKTGLFVNQQVVLVVYVGGRFISATISSNL